MIDGLSLARRNNQAADLAMLDAVELGTEISSLLVARDGVQVLLKGDTRKKNCANGDLGREDKRNSDPSYNVLCNCCKVAVFMVVLIAELFQIIENMSCSSCFLQKERSSVVVWKKNIFKGYQIEVIFTLSILFLEK